MCGVHLLQALADVRDHPAQHLSAHDHTWASHAEVLAGLQCQFAQLVTSAHPRLAQENGLTAVQASQEALEALALDVDVIVGTHEPLEPVQVVVVHVLKHHEGFLLWRVGVVHIFQGHDGDGDGRVRTLAREELHFAWNGLSPGPAQHTGVIKFGELQSESCFQKHTSLGGGGENCESCNCERADVRKGKYLNKSN